jgi:hypothetical protein
MEPAKIVARFRDGQIKKGYSQDFFPNKPVFHLAKDARGTAGEPEAVQVNDLKALFFVKDFSGNPNYKEQKRFMEGDKPSGRKVEVTFLDGEVLEGSVLGYNPKQSGFFLFLADPKGNNIRVFVVNNAIKKFRYL